MNKILIYGFQWGQTIAIPIYTVLLYCVIGHVLFNQWGPAWIPTYYCGKVLSWTGLLWGFMVGDSLPSPPFFSVKYFSTSVSFFLSFCPLFPLFTCHTFFHFLFQYFLLPHFSRCVVLHVGCISCLCVVLCSCQPGMYIYMSFYA